MNQADISTKVFNFYYGGVEKSVILYLGISVQELRNLLAAAFNLSLSQVNGLYETTTQSHIPLSLLCSEAEFYESGNEYSFVIDQNKSSADNKMAGMNKMSMTMNELSFSNADISKLMGIFNRVAPTGIVNSVQFTQCFRDFVAMSQMDIHQKKKMLSMVLPMFRSFDTDGNGVVDATEFLSGLTVLCSGPKEEKIISAFKLYDINGDGYISLDEMKRYLTSVFTVIHHNSSELFDLHGVTPAELGKVTAEQCFMDADLNNDGKLSFEEFKRWYSEPSNATLNTMVSTFKPGADTKSKTYAKRQSSTGSTGKSISDELEQVRKLSGLEHFTPEEVFDVFAEACAGEDLDREQFRECFGELIASRDLNKNDEIDALVIDSLFDIFDADDNGFVDFEELSAGLSVLCKGTRDDKIRAAFSLYDTDGNGVISLEEMTLYMTSVFKVLYETSPDVAASMGLNPEALAEITARQCFEEADLNNDGQLSFEEFKAWYTKPSNAMVPVETEPEVNNDLNWAGLKEVQYLTRLEQYDVQEVVKQFRGFAHDGEYLTREEFRQCFYRLIDSANGELTEDEQPRAIEIVEKLFDLFDEDGNGVVDYRELSTGLSVLCGNRNAYDKIKASFDLYDENGDGFISPEEMETYLCSVFRVIYETVPGTRERMGGMDPEELALITTEECFEECDLDEDGRLSIDEFSNWYLSTTDGQAVHDIESRIPSWMNLDQVRKITGLENHTVEEVFEEFALASDMPNGGLSHDAFCSIFYKLGSGDPDDRTFHMVLDALFSIFDADGNGVVDFSELASGISILCGGDRDDKAAAAFALYDYNGDGFISLSEMERYLTSIFKVMYETLPGTKSKAGGATPEQLASATAEQIFIEADLNGDGKLSQEEFRRWYAQDEEVKVVGKVAEDWITIGETQRLTKLNLYTPQEAFETMAEYASEDGNLGQKEFYEAFHSLILAKGGLNNQQDVDRLRLVLHKLFSIFDVDGNGVVDFAEMASGLCVLCKGDKHTKAAAAFELYDYNGDGFISLSEMERYLSSMFKVMFETQPESRAQAGGLSAEELAEITAEQIFVEADLNGDGKLSLDEFTRWYSQDSGAAAPVNKPVHAAAVARQSNVITMDEMRKITMLENYTAEEAFEILALKANEEGYLDKASFFNAFKGIIKTQGAVFDTQEKRDRLTLALHRLFDIFDQDNNGLVDFTEVASGLSVLCGGDAHQKARAAFELYDLNGDGFISEDEMVNYLTSIFRVMYETDPSTPDRVHGLSPEKLAETTAESVFEHADLNGDNLLSVQEFTRWYTSEPEEEFTLTLDEARRITKLEKYTPKQAFQLLAMEANRDDGYLDKVAFFKAFKNIVLKQGGLKNKSEQEKLVVVLHRLFDIFDQDGNGVVDFEEIASGLSILCAGTKNSKAQAAFELYDYDNDGYISLSEMERYLRSIFLVMYEAQPSTKQRAGGVSAEQLAEVTAEQVFVEADLNGDGKLSLEEFTKWYTKDTSSANTVKGISDQFPDWISLDEVRRLTKLEHYAPQDAFEFLAKAANEDSYLNKPSFFMAFQAIVEENGGHATQEEQDRLVLVLHKLFDIFDADNNGIVDFQEMASGLSVLCGGTRDDKLAKSFALYDYDGDGFISLDEMTHYLSCVFKVMFQMQPQTQQKMSGVSAEELALATAQQVFVDYDLNQDGKLSFDEFQQWYSEEN